MHHSVEDLLLRAATGDEAAFAQWYDATCLPAYRLARCLAPEHADAVLREAYVEAWRRAAHFAPSGMRALPWLLGLVRASAKRVAPADSGRPAAAVA